MNRRFYREFLTSGDTLRIYKGAALLFASQDDGLLALLEYIQGMAVSYRGIAILDKVTGNAAALLSIKAGCREVYSPLGSQLAALTLEKYGIKHHLDQIVPYIKQATSDAMCPMEKLSIDKDPEEFYAVMRALQGHHRELA